MRGKRMSMQSFIIDLRSYWNYYIKRGKMLDPKVARRWWKKYWGYVVTIVLIIALIVLPLVGVFAGWNKTGAIWDWLGFNEHVGPLVPANEQYRAPKTLWDILQLFILPVVLGILAYMFTRLSGPGGADASTQRDRELQSYLRMISKLTLDKKLPTLDSPTEAGNATYAEARRVAQARTATILRRSDADRTANILCFLSKLDLLAVCIEDDLQEADLQAADLSRLNLSNIDLMKADLSHADLSDANLTNTDLSGADLFRAQVTREQLQQAKLSTETIMPDGLLYYDGYLNEHVRAR